MAWCPSSLQPLSCDPIVRQLPPERLACQAGTFGQSLQLGPDDLLVADPRADAAVSAGLDVLASYQPGVPHQALRHEFWMLHQVSGVSNHTWHEGLPLWELHVFPDTPFMLVADVRSLDGIRLRLDLEDNIGDVAQGDIVDMRSMATAPAEVQAHVVFGQTSEGVVDRLDQHLDVLTVLRHG